MSSNNNKNNKPLNPLITSEHKRDAYGFTVRPQHLQRYREYANIYKEEEEERSDRWKSFLERQIEYPQLVVNGLNMEEDDKALGDETTVKEADASSEICVDGHESNSSKAAFDSVDENGGQKEEVPASEEGKIHKVQLWTEIRPSLRAIEYMMSVRVKKKIGSSTDERNENNRLKDEQIIGTGKAQFHTGDGISLKGACEEDSDDEFYDVERSDPNMDVPLANSVSATTNGITGEPAAIESSSPWKEELEVLVRGGVPMALRGELWQAFVGVKARRVEKYYQDLLTLDNDYGSKVDQQSLQSTDNNGKTSANFVCVPEKWKGQIEKDLPRTFPGHPALDEDGRNALRRLLTAYARHNPTIGYCQVFAS